MAEMANYWAARGVNVTIATWSGKDVEDLYWLDARVVRVYLEVPPATHRLAVGAAVLRRVAKLRRLLIATRPDALLSFLTSNNVLSILATRGLNLRVVVSERAHPAHDTNVSLVLRLLRRGLYGWCDEVVAQTRETASWIEETVGDLRMSFLTRYGHCMLQPTRSSR